MKRNDERKKIEAHQNVPNVNNDYGRLTQHQTSGLLSVIPMNETLLLCVSMCEMYACVRIILVLDTLYLHLSFVYQP